MNQMENKNNKNNSSNSLVLGRWPQTKIFGQIRNQMLLLTDDNCVQSRQPLVDFFQNVFGVEDRVNNQLCEQNQAQFLLKGRLISEGTKEPLKRII